MYHRLVISSYINFFSKYTFSTLKSEVIFLAPKRCTLYLTERMHVCNFQKNYCCTQIIFLSSSYTLSTLWLDPRVTDEGQRGAGWCWRNWEISCVSLPFPAFLFCLELLAMLTYLLFPSSCHFFSPLCSKRDLIFVFSPALLTTFPLPHLSLLFQDHMTLRRLWHNTLSYYYFLTFGSMQCISPSASSCNKGLLFR